MSLTPEQRKMRATIAALARWKNEDPAEAAFRGQQGLVAKFEREVDPDNVLSPAERRRRAIAARREHMTRMAFKSSKSRKAKSGESTQDESAVA